MNRDQLRELLQQPYDRQTWQGILRDMFRNVSILASPYAIPCGHEDVESFMEIGSIRLDDGKHLSVFEIKVGEGINLLRNRVELRNLVASHIDQQTRHGVLVIFDGQTNDYRFTFAARETEFDTEGNFVEKETATKRYTYLLGPNEACTTPALRFRQLAEKDEAKLTDVVEAFSVERLNKEFFDSYKRHYEKFVGHLLSGDISGKIFGVTAIEDAKEQDKANKPVRDFAKRLLGRVVFLYFLQKKGWLGCPAGPKEWSAGELDFIAKLFADCPDKDKFHSRCLVPLFYEALNRPDRPGDIFEVTKTRVPYLNGGLFEHESYPVEKIDFPSDLFANLLEFFGQYNFTIDENDPDDHEVGIDPEMLGHIFENLLEDNKDKGAFYTPKPIVQYMCQQSLLFFLQSKLGEHEELTRLVRYKDAGERDARDNWVRQNAKRIEELLDQVKICDPAIGSGAFPIGLLLEIYWLKLILDWTLDPAETKLKIIQNSIYGVDIDAGAVEIARLRFWLALIVDEDQPRPLPNLDYKIMQGDSLLESFEGIPLDSLHEPERHKVAVFPPRQAKLFDVKSQPSQGSLFAASAKEILTATEKAAEITAMTGQYFNETNPLRKQELHQQIDRFVLDHIDYNLQLKKEKLEIELLQHQAVIAANRKQLKSWKPPQKTEKRLAALEGEIKAIRQKKAKLAELETKPERPYFLWHLFCRDVFEQDGFDIVIGNPPYGVTLRKELKYRYQTFSSRGESYVLFVERGIELLKEDGQFCYIMPDTYLNLSFTAPLRDFLLKNSRLQEVVVLPAKVFQDATVDTTLLFTSKVQACDSFHEINVRVKIISKQSRQLNLEVPNRIETISTKWWKEQGAFNITSNDKESALLKRLTQNFRTINDISDMFSGIKTYEVGKGKPPQTEDIRVTRPFTSTSRLHEGFLPFFDGKHVGRYSLLWRDNNWLHYGPWLAAPRKPENFIGGKILIRKIVADTLIATYVSDTSYCNTLLHILKLKPNVPLALLYLLGILNSRFIGWYFRTKFQISAEDTFPQIMISDIQQFPVPEVSDMQQLPIIERVKKILADPNSTEAPHLDAEIDQLVYSLYGLSAEEIEVVAKKIVVQPELYDKKTSLFTRHLPTLKKQSAYFSLAAAKRSLASAEIELADDTLREYMSEAMASGIVGDAGRGWYSRHLKPVSLDSKPVTKLIRAVAKAFPLLDFCCWSTSQLNPFAQHLIAQPTAFLYAESDTLESVAEHLRTSGWDTWANPGKKEAAQFVRPGDKTVVLRPAIVKQPPSQYHLAPIEKVLVDLKIEADKLQLMDTAEVQRILENVLGSGLLQLPVLLRYAEAKGEKIESGEITH